MSHKSTSKTQIATCCFLLVLQTITTITATPIATGSIRYVPLDHGLKFAIAIGTPPQTFEVLFDTGSAGTWVSSTHYKPRRVLDLEPIWVGSHFDPGLSSTWTPRAKVWHMTYAIGAALKGTIGTDNMHLADSATIVRNQTFALATNVEGWISGMFAMDGAIGVGERYEPFLGADDPVQTMFKQQLIPKQMFSLHLDERNAQQQFNGTLILGGIDANYFTGPLHFVPILSRWELDLDYVGVLGKEQLFGVQSTVLLDSSSNVLVGPYDEVGGLIELFEVGPLKRYGLRQFQTCREAYSSSVRLVISIGERRFELSTSDLTIKLKSKGQEACYLAIKGFFDDDQEKADKFDYWTLGTPFLKKYYTVYDYGNKSVGFADAKRP